MPVSPSDVVIDMFFGALLSSRIIDVVTGFGVDAMVGVLENVNTDVLAGVMTALDFANSEPFEGFSC